MSKKNNPDEAQNNEAKTKTNEASNIKHIQLVIINYIKNYALNIKQMQLKTVKHQSIRQKNDKI